jgi:DNA-directed RNA polymerase specialized sigma subunit
MRAQVNTALSNVLSVEWRYTALEKQLPKPSAKKGGRKREQALVEKLVALQKLYNEKWDELLFLRLRIEEAISSLDDSIERRLMRLRYFEGKRWEVIAVEVGYSIQHVWRLHGFVLEKMRENESINYDNI